MSGEYHMYRGILNPTGVELLRLFDSTIDELEKNNAIDNIVAREQKADLRNRIQEVG